MKKTSANTALLFLLALFIAVQPIWGQQTKKIRATISVDEFDKKLHATKQPQLIDVRTPEEFVSGHLKNAININVDGPTCKIQFGKLNKNKPVFVYCLAGKRGEKTIDILQQLGFKEVYNMKGGITEWQKAGKPVVKEKHNYYK